MTENVHGKGERPSPLEFSETLRDLGRQHDELEQSISHRNTNPQADKVTKSDGAEHPAPGNWMVVAMRADIHRAAVKWASMLIDDRGLHAPTPTTTSALLGFVATYPGYFTNHDDAAVAHHAAAEATELNQRASGILDPDTETRRTPIGPCMVDTCDGTLVIKWTKFEGDDDERAWRMGNSRPVAKCNQDGSHKIDAMLYAAGRRG